MDNFFSNLKYICPTNLLENIEKFRLTESKIIWEIKNEIKPIDLYCYLVAKFGSPEPSQNNGQHVPLKIT